MILLGIFFRVHSGESDLEERDFFECLEDKEVVVYIFFGEEESQRQILELGSFSKILTHDCSELTRDSDYCATGGDAGFPGYPTTRYEGYYYSGFKDKEELSIISGCNLTDSE